jgi:hypothetical protein
MAETTNPAFSRLWRAVDSVPIQPISLQAESSVAPEPRAARILKSTSFAAAR